ncbi:acyl-phosphate--glycerol-3-phosphate O-acyltransferase [Helicobacter monodelphidis]|uniref:glycerol-3-phosphate 1-O-acyltransferase PlsY n=1 Tax=Helicobacter sp. 15-1451 TaxID=2004995 RepID=UPI000DCD74E0|nr:glycerol-3-phosphate 1-O-acyltransferase PlsY [Helicobacter sp. 15-1451]RAX56832.1 acyl-phosphate--glycerol-3-phosphate O-acyltransferase [Helicobacter sp. 15-1451]
MEILSNINIQFYLITYLIAGIPFGMLIVKIIYGINLREAGSGSIGVTNVLRVVKEIDAKKAKILALTTFIFDATKGAVIILIAKYFFDISAETQWAIAVLSVIGHCFSPYLGFEGGKGIATGVGVMFVMLPLEAVIGLVAWFIVGKVFRVSSLASMAGLFGFLISNYFLHPVLPIIQTHAPIIIIAFIILYKHIPNIKRLIQGKEEKVI